MAQNYVRYTYVDNSGEKSHFKIYLPTIDGANLGTVLTGIDSLGAAVFGGLMAILSYDAPVSHELVVDNVKYPGAVAASPWAMNELGLRVTFQDNVTAKLGHVTIPAPKWDAIGMDDTDMVDPTDVQWLAFVTAFEAFARSADGNAVTVTEGRLVGRNR